jgi:excisionase family DNA binding protein
MSTANFSSHFLTIAEVAAAMRVSKMTVYRLVKSHAIAAVRVGRSFRVPEEAVNDYIRRSTEPATPGTPATPATPGQGADKKDEKKDGNTAD